MYTRPWPAGVDGHGPSWLCSKLWAGATSSTMLYCKHGSTMLQNQQDGSTECSSKKKHWVLKQKKALGAQAKKSTGCSSEKKHWVLKQKKALGAQKHWVLKSTVCSKGRERQSTAVTNADKTKNNIQLQ